MTSNRLSPEFNSWKIYIKSKERVEHLKVLLLKWAEGRYFKEGLNGHYGGAYIRMSCGYVKLIMQQTKI